MASLDTIFDLLARERRRYALYYLENQDGKISIDELTRAIVEWESDPSEAISQEELDEVNLELRHVHLPKTAEVDFIEYDTEEGIVQVSGEPSEFDTVLTVAEVIERPKTTN